MSKVLEGLAALVTGVAIVLMLVPDSSPIIAGILWWLGRLCFGTGVCAGLLHSPWTLVVGMVGLWVAAVWCRGGLSRR